MSLNRLKLLWLGLQTFWIVLEVVGGKVATSNADQLANTNATKPPNIIVMLMDDMGWGDLGSNGDPTHETVHLDRMAREGMLLTDFYAGNPLCSPSRAAFLTGRLPIRNGFYSNNTKARNSYIPQEMVGGISPAEILLPELLSKVGYRNKIVGKWHLGHSRPEFYPLHRGFHEFFGSTNVHFGPYGDKKMPNVPFFRDDRMIGRYYENILIDRKNQLSNLTQEYTDEAIRFMEKESASGKPFFLYWTPDTLHAPTFRSEKFLGRSLKQSSYGDALIEIDDSVGRILQTIKNNPKLSDNTFVFFTSDNGPALTSREDAGSNGPLLCGKQTTFEGGVREPAIAWWPGRIKPGTVSRQIATIMDLYRTIANLAGAKVVEDRVYDSVDIGPVLFENDKKIQNSMFYYRGDTLMAVRNGPYKAHFWTFSTPPEELKQRIDYCPGQKVKNLTTPLLTHHEPYPMLYHLDRDPGERYTIAAHTHEYQMAMKQIRSIYQHHIENLKPGNPDLNWCDHAAMLWAPPGCDQIKMCLPKPKSAPYLCEWPH